MANTHEVFNQPLPLTDRNLFTGNQALGDALHFNAPQLPTDELRRLGEQAGSASMQSHARLANVHTPRLLTHDRFGHRVDQVEFHPSYHALMGNGGLAAEWGPKLTQRGYDPRFAPISQKTGVTMGMGMTETQGGSDVWANTTQARFDGRDAWGERYTRVGHKWFFSARSALAPISIRSSRVRCRNETFCTDLHRHPGVSRGDSDFNESTS